MSRAVLPLCCRGEASEPELELGLGVRSPGPTAIRPNWVAAPVATTTASAVPSCTTVPMNRHDDNSANAAPIPEPAALALLIPFPFIVWGADEAHRYLRRHTRQAIEPATSSTDTR